MKSFIHVLVSAMILFVGAAASAEDVGSCQSQYYTCLITPNADISGCITQNQQCLNNAYQVQVQQYQQQQQQELQSLLAAFYGTPVAQDPWTALLYGYDPRVLSAAFASAQQYAYEQQAIQSYFEQQQQLAQRNQDQLNYLFQLLYQQ